MYNVDLDTALKLKDLLNSIDNLGSDDESIDKVIGIADELSNTKDFLNKQFKNAKITEQV